ncbi:MAG: SDR family NAD(P)-dependent oxidoreductase [Spirochaetaceae bacterium]|nr:MAG: SDR family NAD(P)-dependent oxidoreductase [Spirochaetaceae bacterium]
MKYIVVTGASTGIGFGTVAEFIRKQYFVFGSVRNNDDASRLQMTFGQTFKPLIFDITDESAVENAANIVKNTIHGAGLAGLINNAGVAVSGPLMHTSMKELRYQYEVNVTGQMIVTKAFLPLLGARMDNPFPPGKIVFISSSSGKVAHLFLGAYVGSKHAIEGIAHVLRIELQLYKIGVVIIGPGAVNSAIWDKESAQGGAELFRDTDYGPSVSLFQKYFIKSGKSGFDVLEAGKRIVKIFEKKKNRLRYPLVKNKFRKWIIPRLLPSNAFDRKIAEKFGLLKK